MNNRMKTQILAVLFVALYLIAGVYSLACYESFTFDTRLRVVDCGPRRSCYMLIFKHGRMRGCGCGVYPTGLIKRPGLWVYHCNSYLCNENLP